MGIRETDKAPSLPFDMMSSAPLFRDLPADVRQKLFQSGRLQSLRKGQRLFGRGDTGGAIFVVISGIIEISVSLPTGRKISLNMMAPGNCFGEMSVLDEAPRSADAFALAPSVLLTIPRAAFLEQARQQPDLALSLARLMSERIRWISDSVEDYALLSLDRRLARRLLILFERFGNAENQIAMSQADVADFVGATRESTNKILQAWRKSGWIDIGRKTITLLDRKQLDAFAMSPAASN